MLKVHMCERPVPWSSLCHCLTPYPWTRRSTSGTGSVSILPPHSRHRPQVLVQPPPRTSSPSIIPPSVPNASL